MKSLHLCRQYFLGFAYELLINLILMQVNNSASCRAKKSLN